jgi:hypothetical protein
MNRNQRIWLQQFAKLHHLKTEEEALDKLIETHMAWTKEINKLANDSKEVIKK